MPVDARPQLAQRIVEMERADRAQSDEPHQIAHRSLVAFARTDVVTRREQMARVDAHAHVLGRADAAHDVGEMLEAVADRRALPGANTAAEVTAPVSADTMARLRDAKRRARER